MTTPPEQPTTITDQQLETAVLRLKALEFGSGARGLGERPLVGGTAAPALGPLENFTGMFHGNGFNTIFRPQNSASPTQLPISVPGSDNVPELNLTSETLV
jgi:hypothetical protein